MSTKLPIVRVKVLEKILLLLGFVIKRRKGSHVFYRHADGRYTTLPHHGNQELGTSFNQTDIKRKQYHTGRVHQINQTGLTLPVF